MLEQHTEGQPSFPNLRRLNVADDSNKSIK